MTESTQLTYKRIITAQDPPAGLMKPGDPGFITIQATTDKDDVCIKNISVDLQPHDLHPSQWITGNADTIDNDFTSQPSPGRHRFEASPLNPKTGFKYEAPPGPGDPPGDYVFPKTVYKTVQNEQVPKNSLTVVLRDFKVSDGSGTAIVRITEESALSHGKYSERVYDIEIQRMEGGATFENFRPHNTADIVTQQGHRVDLDWDIEIDEKKYKRYHGPPDPTPTGSYYAVTLDYDQLREPKYVTGAYTSTTNALFHSTIFTLTLTLYDADRDLHQSYFQQLFISVDPTFIRFKTLAVQNCVNLLGDYHSWGKGEWTAKTDGLLLCSVQADGVGNPSGLSITLNSREHGQPYKITTKTPSVYDSNRSSDCSTSILLPISKGSYVALKRISGMDHGTYQAIFHPLGVGTGTYVGSG